MSSKTYEILSWNVHGLGSVVKKRQVNEWLWRTNASIMCIQEHHLDNQGIALFRLTHPKMECFASVKSKGIGGAAIMVKSEWCTKLAFNTPLRQSGGSGSNKEGEDMDSSLNICAQHKAREGQALGLVASKA